MRACAVASEYAGSQTESGGVGALDGFGFVVKHQQRQYGAENLFLHDAHVVAAVGKNRGRDEVATPASGHLDGGAAADQCGTFRDAAGHIAQHLVAVRCGNQSADFGCRVGRIAYP